MTIKTKDELMKAGMAYIDASQKLKAAKDVLAERREAIIPAFNKLCRADENGNRTMEFDGSKIMLVPARKVDEQALKAKLGIDATRFIERHLVISVHTISHRVGVDKAKDIVDDIKAVLDEHLSSEPTLLRNAVKTVRELDTDAALASLGSEDQDEVKIEVSQTLRPYPAKEGFDKKVEAAKEWLDS
jgi:hypothetical protein